MRPYMLMVVCLNLGAPPIIIVSISLYKQMMKKLKQLGLGLLALPLMVSCATSKKGAELSASTQLSQDVKSVNSETPQGEIYEVAEVEAEFPGGQVALLRYINEHVKYPASAVKAGLQGMVIVRFVVERDGSVGDATVTKSLSPDCDKESIRLIQSLPNFKPAKIKGEPVRKWFTVPVRFILQ